MAPLIVVRTRPEPGLPEPAAHVTATGVLELAGALACLVDDWGSEDQ